MIDLLNQRLSAGTQLRQREVLHIFSVAKAVARLHHRTKPTIHRDLKVSTVESLYNIHIRGAIFWLYTNCSLI